MINVFVFNKLIIDEGSAIHFFKFDYYYLNKDLSNIFLQSIEKISFKLIQDVSLMMLSITGLILTFIMIKKNIFENKFFKLVYIY